MKKFLILLFLILGLFLIIAPSASLATAPTPTTISTGSDDLHGLTNTAQVAGLPITGSVPQFLGMIAGAALALAGSIFLFLMIYGGIMIMVSAGNSERAEKGKKIITWAIIGVLVLGGAYAITAFIFQSISQTAK